MFIMQVFLSQDERVHSIGHKSDFQYMTPLKIFGDSKGKMKTDDYLIGLKTLGENDQMAMIKGMDQIEVKYRSR